MIEHCLALLIEHYLRWVRMGDYRSKLNVEIWCSTNILNWSPNFLWMIIIPMNSCRCSMNVCRWHEFVDLAWKFLVSIRSNGPSGHSRSPLLLLVLFILILLCPFLYLSLYLTVSFSNSVTFTLILSLSLSHIST